MRPKKAAKKIKANPAGWRLKYATRHAVICIMVEKCYKKKPRPLEEIVMENIERLKFWPTEKAYLSWAKKSCSEMDDLIKQKFRLDAMAES
jgi:hypothetical protein